MNYLAKAELEKFKSFATKEDYELIIEDDITFYDFRRLDCILGTLELNHLEIYFFNKHCNKFEERIEYLEKIHNEYSDDWFNDLDTYDKWLNFYVKFVPKK